MFNLASSLLYSSLFNQQGNGEQVYEGSAARKTPTYNLGVKGIPDEVIWALSAVNLGQYDLPEWKITLGKNGVKLGMEWKHPNEHMEDENEIQNHHDSHEKSVIKKLQGNALGLPVGKLVNNTNELHSPHLGYTTRMPQMQSILTIRPDQYRQTGTPLSNLPHSLLNRESVIQPRPVSANGRTKANSVESPQEKSDEELIEPGSPDKPYLPINHEEKSAENAMDVDESKICASGCGTIKVESPSEVSRREERYISTEASEDMLETRNLQIDEDDDDEDVDVTDDPEPGKKHEFIDTANEPWNNLPQRKSPIEQLLEHRSNLLQGGMNFQQNPSPFHALGMAQGNQSIYNNPMFLQNLRNASVLQQRGLTQQTLPLLMPQNNQNGQVITTKPNQFLSTAQSNPDTLKGLPRTSMISPVGRSPGVCHLNGQMMPRPADKLAGGGKDKGPFSCSLCGRTFSLRGNLLRHERIHRGDKPFRCRFCNKAFIQRTDVLAHERVHTGEKPFACQYCGKRFPRRSTMKEHEKSFCRARVAFEENRKNKTEDGTSPISSESASPDDKLTISGLIALTENPQKSSSSSSAASNSSEGDRSSKTPSPEHPSQMPENKGIDATDFSVKAVIAQ